MSRRTWGRNAGKLASMDAATIGERIRQRMAAYDPPLEEIDIAAAARVGQSTVSRWINDISSPSAEKLPPLARVLGVPIYWLLTGHFETMADWLDEGAELVVPAPLSPEQIQEAAAKFTLDQWVEARHSEGLTDEEIGSLLYEAGKRHKPLPVEPTEEPSEQPVVEGPSDEEIAEHLARRPDGPGGNQGGSRRDQRGTKRRRSSGEEEQS